MLFALSTLMLVSACASSHMRDVPEPVTVSKPTDNTATLVLMRPSIFGGAIQSSVFDITSGDPQFVGIVSAGKKLAYEAPAGKRRLMVVGESADFMDADFAAEQIYFARVAPRLGLWKARFSLEPVPASSPDLESDLRACTWVENTPASRDWARSNMVNINAKKAEYLPDWNSGSDKPFLAQDTGRKARQ
ncbi:hypothetical protein [Azospirillum doebereinerae]|uniref:DUF2846 domain-containing protein n=1 Tax=Azospirillum doebereinerae TaxID=92933 RepID=A0A3S0WIJ5_9PROT|nr:hypothetical protein [Azospirillum doebereinerae]MCG5240497.1 hypothetical protein [Azospirillum doebereinerae]RUQ63699.1 hypothetical protein EJ913_27590 [Azospirillum doebereinerae]